MTQLLTILLTVVALALQTTLFKMYGSLAPDVMLIVAVFAGLNYRRLEGFQVGLIAGLVQDLLSYGMLGVNLLAKSLIGFSCGYLREMNVVAISSRGTWAFLIILSTILNEFILQVVQNGFYGIEVTALGLISSILMQSLINLVFGIPLFILLNQLRRFSRSFNGEQHF